MENERGYFHCIDWLVFASVLLLFALAGLWHYITAMHEDTKEYLLGGKNLKLFPVSASLFASFVSAVTILVTPSEIYNFGTQYWLSIISLVMSGIIVANVYLPVFRTLKLNSTYEYLELRFNKGVRLLISLIFIFDMILCQSIVVYVPALALNQVSGINIHLIGCIASVISVSHTVMGGFRAIIWTDTLQVIVTMTAIVSITILGTCVAGGPSAVWEKASEMKRIQFFNFDSSPYTRHTVWTVLIGSCLYSTAYIAVNQTMVQRYQSLSTVKICKQAIGWFTVGAILFISLCCWCGLVLVAWWSPPKCDPRATDLIASDEELLTFFTVEIIGKFHGVPGLFVSSICGLALSSLSVRLNSTAVVLLEDFVKGCFHLQPTEMWAHIFVKSVIFLLGFITVGLILLIQNFGELLSITNSLAAVASGVSFGVFSLGMLCPWTNSKGAFVGAIIGIILSGWATLGANMAIESGEITPKKLPVALDGCPANVSESFLKQFKYHSEDNIFPPYRLSYHWYAPLGTIIVVLVGGAVTWMTGPLDPSSLDKKLFSPVIHRWIPEPKLNDGSCKWRRKSSAAFKAALYKPSEA